MEHSGQGDEGKSFELAMILRISMYFHFPVIRIIFEIKRFGPNVRVIEKYGAVDTTSARTDDMRCARGTKRQI